MADQFTFENFQQDIEAIIRATLPEDTTLWRFDRSIRGSWETKETPYLTHECGPFEDAEEYGAIGGNYTWMWTGHFIERLPASLEYVWGTLEDLKRALRVANMGVDGFPLSGVTLLSAVPDVSREAEVNEIFYGSNKPFLGGCLKARFVGGNLD